MVGGHATLVFPMEGILALEQQYRATAVRGAISGDGVIGVRLFPYLRIAEIHLAAALGQVRRRQHGVSLVLNIVHAVAYGRALGLIGLQSAVLPALLAHARIHQQLAAVRKLDGAAGEAAILVVGHIRGQRGGQALPTDEIPRLDVSPMHRAPHGLVGVVLKEQMVFSLVDGEAVGIVDPADRAGHMVCRTLVLRHKGAVLLFELPCLLQHFTRHGDTLPN